MSELKEFDRCHPSDDLYQVELHPMLPLPHVLESILILSIVSRPLVCSTHSSQ